ncbi:MAG: ABC transporter ATP-binding protein [Mycobacteriales bacterium]
MIRLEGLQKHYPGQERPAVTSLDMDIPEGEIVILVGPSGCGKTTTLKMINRIIEPSGGKIFLQGEDVTRTNADALRRRIGYVIQQVGLFPHHTIAANIAVVPKMLGWDKRRIDSRVDELLDLVGLDPARYRDRYPKELSGGQNQRVGVARALGADPPVMLMDEPFGAIDPITRERLQNEFLRLQGEIKKTIVFVTHDIDEAIKMGDRIAILGEESTIAQYDTPSQILANPANEFVEDFLGAGPSVKRLTLTRVSEIEVDPWPTIHVDAAGEEVSTAFDKEHEDYLLVLDTDRRPKGWLARADSASTRTAGDRLLPVLSPVTPRSTLFDALNIILQSYSTCAVVVDEQGVYRGTLEMERIRSLIHIEQNGDGRRGAAAVDATDVSRQRS